ncbi:hypothetical protein [Shewanella aegiceratis]|uniref:hypothetical protein n=1 Tax=Shewanella aegiceratis TaxID=2864203 RepID=UPI001C660E69|nr:hypothetical protein [Shewanella aegiceratis]QYJ83814.1 hypothetical protein K0H80_07450 [Shewanella aegiceratis]
MNELYENTLKLAEEWLNSVEDEVFLQDFNRLNVVGGPTVSEVLESFQTLQPYYMKRDLYTQLYDSEMDVQFFGICIDALPIHIDDGECCSANDDEYALAA